MKNEIIKNKVVYEFMNQWFCDAMVHIEREPARYEVHTETCPTEYGYRPVTTIYDTTSHECGESICSEHDAYDFRLGIAIAWAKLHSIPLPRQLRPRQLVDLRKVKPGTSCYCPKDDRELYVLSKTRDNKNSIVLIVVRDETFGDYDVISLADGGERFMVEIG